MKISNKQNKLGFFTELYTDAKNHMSDIFEKFDTYTEQYNGSDKIDGSNERATAVRNITYEIIESQISSEIPAPCVSALAYSEKRERNAKNIERLLCEVRDRLPFETLNDMDERYTYILGGSVWLAEWDNSDRKGGDVRIHCINPRDFIPEPNIYKIEDMEYCFIRFDTTVNYIASKYNVKDSELCLLAPEEDAKADSATMIMCFYRDENGEVCRFVWCNELVLSDDENYYRRKKRVCKKCGAVEGECSCNSGYRLSDDTEEVIYDDIILEDGDRIPSYMPIYDDNGELIVDVNENGVPMARMERTHIAYYVPREFPIIIRKNTSRDKTLFGQSDCEFMRSQQQAINKVESRIMQKLMRSGITPIVPDDAELTLDNRIFGQVIKMKPSENRSMYGTIDTTPNIMQDIAEADRLYEQAKRVIGISDTYQGFSDDHALSGVAKQLQVNQAAGRLESKKKMKHAAYADIDRIVFSLYLAYSDEPRELSYKDALGRVQNLCFNKYDFLRYDKKRHRYYYDDDYLFSVDQNGSVELRREYIWQKNLENLNAGTLGAPDNDETLLRYWQSQERAHYPFARDNVEYFKSRIMSADSEKIGLHNRQAPLSDISYNLPTPVQPLSDLYETNADTVDESTSYEKIPDKSSPNKRKKAKTLTKKSAIKSSSTKKSTASEAI